MSTEPLSMVLAASPVVLFGTVHFADPHLALAAPSVMHGKAAAARRCTV